MSSYPYYQQETQQTAGSNREIGYDNRNAVQHPSPHQQQMGYQPPSFPPPTSSQQQYMQMQNQGCYSRNPMPTMSTQQQQQHQSQQQQQFRSSSMTSNPSENMYLQQQQQYASNNALSNASRSQQGQQNEQLQQQQQQSDYSKYQFLPYGQPTPQQYNNYYGGQGSYPYPQSQSQQHQMQNPYQMPTSATSGQQQLPTSGYSYQYGQPNPDQSYAQSGYYAPPPQAPPPMQYLPNYSLQTSNVQGLGPVPPAPVPAPVPPPIKTPASKEKPITKRKSKGEKKAAPEIEESDWTLKNSVKQGEEEEILPEPKETKKSVPIMVGKRRGGRVTLPTGVVKKQRAESPEAGTRTDAWSQYMNEVKRYKDRSCEDERKNRPLVK